MCRIASFRSASLHFECRAPKAHHFLADRLCTILSSRQCAAADEENLLRVDLNIFLVRMFRPPCGEIAGAAFENFRSAC